MIGTRIGHYVLVRQIGEGGTGAVYLAKHHSLGARKAVKVLLPKYSKSPSLIWRFQNEAITIARLDHRNIVSVDDFGQLPDGQWYLMMPFLEGISLDRVLQRSGRLPLHQSLHILAQVCAALDAAHSTGVVHRDVKPANVFLTKSVDDPWRVTLLDFGVAKLIGAEASEHSTEQGQAFGTPAFMAAEVIANAAQAKPSSDVFSLGVMAYLMVTGELPFGAHSASVLYSKQMHARPRRPEGAPAAWTEELLLALALRPEHRPRSAGAFALALAAATPAELPGYPSGADILAAVARELVAPGSGPVAARAGAAASLSQQLRAPLWPPTPGAVPPTTSTCPRVEDLPPEAPSFAVLGTGSSAATTSTMTTTFPLRLGLRDLILHPARTPQRLFLWAVIAIVTAVLVAAWCRMR